MSLSGTSARSLPAELRSPPDAVPLPQVHKGAKYDTWWILLQHPLILLQHPLRRRLILYSIHQHTDTLSHWTLLQHPWDVIRDHDRNDNISLHFTKLLLQIHAWLHADSYRTDTFFRFTGMLLTSWLAHTGRSWHSIFVLVPASWPDP